MAGKFVQLEEKRIKRPMFGVVYIKQRVTDRDKRKRYHLRKKLKVTILHRLKLGRYRVICVYVYSNWITPSDSRGRKPDAPIRKVVLKKRIYGLM